MTNFIKEQQEKARTYWNYEHNQPVRKLHPEMVNQIVSDTIKATAERIKKQIEGEFESNHAYVMEVECDELISQAEEE